MMSSLSVFNIFRCVVVRLCCSVFIICLCLSFPLLWSHIFIYIYLLSPYIYYLSIISIVSLSLSLFFLLSITLLFLLSLYFCLSLSFVVLFVLDTVPLHLCIFPSCPLLRHSQFLVFILPLSLSLSLSLPLLTPTSEYSLTLFVTPTYYHMWCVSKLVYHPKSWVLGTLDKFALETPYRRATPLATFTPKVSYPTSHVITPLSTSISHCKNKYLGGFVPVPAVLCGVAKYVGSGDGVP